MDHGRGFSLVTRPVADQARIYFSTGYSKPEMQAVKLGGRGELTPEHLAWRQDKSAPNQPSPVLHNSIPSWQSKWYLTQGGVNTPFIVTGPMIGSPGAECDALVSSVDVFATVADLAGVDLQAVYPNGVDLDSISMLPFLIDPATPSIRPWTFSESFLPNGFGPNFNDIAVGIYDGTWKLIASRSDPTDMFSAACST